MGKIIYSNCTGDYKTVVTIVPTFEFDYYDDDIHYPAASVQVDYNNGDNILARATFKKILVGSPYRGTPDQIIDVADEMINGDLSRVGLGGLSTLDIYKALGESTKLNADIMQKILTDSLNIPCYDDNDSREKDCIYKLEVWVYKIR